MQNTTISNQSGYKTIILYNSSSWGSNARRTYYHLLNRPVNALLVSGGSFASYHISLSLAAMIFMQKNLPREQCQEKFLQCSKWALFAQTLHEHIWQQSRLTEILKKHAFRWSIAWKKFIIATISNWDSHFEIHIRIFQLASKYASKMTSVSRQMSSRGRNNFGDDEHNR